MRKRRPFLSHLREIIKFQRGLGEIAKEAKETGKPGGERSTLKTEMASSGMTLGLNKRLRSSSNARCCCIITSDSVFVPPHLGPQNVECGWIIVSNLPLIHVSALRAIAKGPL